MIKTENQCEEDLTCPQWSRPSPPHHRPAPCPARCPESYGHSRSKRCNWQRFHFRQIVMFGFFAFTGSTERTWRSGTSEIQSSSVSCCRRSSWRTRGFLLLQTGQSPGPGCSCKTTRVKTQNSVESRSVTWAVSACRTCKNLLALWHSYL